MVSDYKIDKINWKVYKKTQWINQKVVLKAFTLFSSLLHFKKLVHLKNAINGDCNLSVEVIKKI